MPKLICPRYLSPDAKKEWKKVVPELEKFGSLLSLDSGILELYCSTMADCRELEKMLKTEGRTITTPNGMSQTSPAWTQLRQARQDACRFATQLGLTPKSRKSINLSKPEEEVGDFK